MDADRLARQWLETDAAFGVAEVPIPRARGGRDAPVVAAVPAPSAKTQAAVARPSVVAPPAVRASSFGVRPVSSLPVRPVVAPAVPVVVAKGKVEQMKAKVVLPAAPAGLIADLPAITRKEKEAGMARLLKELEAACAPYISDVCTRVVFGEGDVDAPILFIGEGPGVEEDKTGRPFVGRSGQLLDKMIGAIGFKREQVYIANIVKLRAADRLETGRLQDRPPTPEEVARGIPFLHRQIEILRPKVIVTLGAPAVKHLTGTMEGVMKIRGTWLEYRGVPVMPTYHPSFVLRAYTEENRRKVWGDLKAAAQRAAEER